MKPHYKNKLCKMKYTTIILLACIISVIGVRDAFAHKVIVFAWVEDGMIHTQSSFGSNRKAQDCKLTIVDEEGVIVHQGLTDDQGEYAFKIPPDIKSDLVVNLVAGTGHKGYWRLSYDELVLPTTSMNIEQAMDNKKQLEQSPSVFKILGGVGIIILLAFVMKFLKRKKAVND